MSLSQQVGSTCCERGVVYARYRNKYGAQCDIALVNPTIYNVFMSNQLIRNKSGTISSTIRWSGQLWMIENKCMSIVGLCESDCLQLTTYHVNKFNKL